MKQKKLQLQRVLQTQLHINITILHKKLSTTAVRWFTGGGANVDTHRSDAFRVGLGGANVINRPGENMLITPSDYDKDTQDYDYFGYNNMD